MKAKPAKVPESPRKSRIGPKRIAALAAVILLSITAAVLILRHTQPAPLASDQPPQSDYVDSAECATCHKDIAATYAKTGMGRSFSQPSATSVIEDYAHNNTYNHQPSAMHYTMLARNGEYFQRRSQQGPDGNDINVMEERIDYIVGSGNHSRSYLHRASDGQLMELPVSWYSERAGYWAMSPGYDRKDQKDFNRPVTGECMFCHNAYPQGATEIDRSIFPATIPLGIDCQRCHGPGRAHVEAARTAHLSPELLRSTIVNPENLGRERQLEVCMQCHMETSIHEPNEQRLFDRAVFSFKPGQAIADYKLYVEPVAAAKDDSFEIAHAAYRLRKSACFLNSQMTCLTCHDPHDIPHGTEALAHYTEVCLNCHRNVAHTVALPAQSPCISCHMPKRRTEDAVHVIMTDHFIRRTQPKRDLLGPIAEAVTPDGVVNKVALYYPAKLPTTPAAEIALAEAQVGDHGIERLQAQLEKYRPNTPAPYIALARAYQREGNDPEVAHWSQQARLRRGDFQPAIVELAPALFATHQDAAGIAALEQGVARYPTDGLLLCDIGIAYLRQGQITQAIDTLNRAVKANPEQGSESHNLLGIIAAGQGDLAAAEREYREAIRLQPDFAQANTNLGGILTQSHNYKDAAFYFEKALATDPHNTDAHHYYGRLLAFMDQIPRSIAQLREAAAEAATDVQVHEDLADLLIASGHPSEAEAEFERVLTLQPNQPHAELGLAMSLLNQHKLDQARPHLEIAARGSDPTFAQTASGILAQLPHE